MENVQNVVTSSLDTETGTRVIIVDGERIFVEK